MRSQADWNRDPQVVYDAIGTNLGTDAFDAYTPANRPDLVDPNLLVDIPRRYNAIMTINNNFGASPGDTLIVGNFVNDGQFVISVYARPVVWTEHIDDPRYDWYDQFAQAGLSIMFYLFEPGTPVQDWQLVWDPSMWRDPQPSSTDSLGREGFYYEWQTTYVVPPFALDSWMHLAVVLDRSAGYEEGTVYANWSWMMDDYTGHGVSAESDPDQPTDLKVYPNPARRGQLRTIKGLEQGESWRLFDAVGRLVVPGSTDSRINTSGLSPGLYLLRTNLGQRAKLTIK